MTNPPDDAPNGAPIPPAPAPDAVPPAPDAASAASTAPAEHAAPSAGVAPARGGRGPLGYFLAGAGGVLVGMVAFALIGSLAGEPAGSGDPDASAVPSAGMSASPGASPAPTADAGAYERGMALGDPDAPVTIEVWADYQCPFCALQAHGVEPAIERMYVATGQASMVFRDFAFLGQESFDAAVAARCAGQQDTYWHYHDLVFASQGGENQGAFARERLLGLASFAGLDEAAFTACLDDPAVRAAVEAETAEGRTYGVTSTPTLRIVGPMSTQVVTGLKPLPEIEAAVERSINEAPAPSPSPGPSGGPSGSPGGGPSASPSPAASPAASPSP